MNDISFLIGHNMNLYKHQSTFNPNMPLRGLFYLVDLYKIYIKDEDLLGSSLVTIPTPHYVVFYNGAQKQEDEVILKLSDDYEDKKIDSCLELEVKMLNINLGHNQELLEKCKCLHGYAVFVDRVRQYAQEDDLEQAVDKAIEDCLEEEGIGELLKKQKAEVKNITLYELLY